MLFVLYMAVEEKVTHTCTLLDFCFQTSLVPPFFKAILFSCFQLEGVDNLIHMGWYDLIPGLQAHILNILNVMSVYRIKLT